MTSDLIDVYGHNRKITATCTCCYGSGEMLGGGCIKTKCTLCDGTGFNKPTEDVHKSLDKRSKEYKEAVKELIRLGLSKEEAEEKLKDGVKNGSSE